MKDQSSRMPISLKGIDRRPADNLPDGALLDLINLRYDNSALRPVPEKVRLSVSYAIRVLYRHTISETTYAEWGIFNDNGTLYLGYIILVNGTGVSQVLNLRSFSAGVTFSSLGNACYISEKVGEKIIVMLFNPDTLVYRVFDGFLPEMPFISYQRVAYSTDDEIYYSTGFDHVADPEEEYTMTDAAFKGYAQEMLAKKLKIGHLVGKYMVRVAWELFDGTIVFHSTPMYITLGLIEGREHQAARNWQEIRFTGYKLQYKIELDEADLAILKTQFTGIVRSFNIYITNTSSLYERVRWLDLPRNNYYSDWKDITVADTYDPRDGSWINSEINYFEIAKVDLANLVSNAYTTVVTKADLSDISSGIVMTVGNLAAHRLYSNDLFTYNSRIFLGNVKNTLFRGMSLRGIMYPGSNYTTGNVYEIGLTFDIETASGTKRTFSGWNTTNHYRTGTPDYYQFTLHDYIGYPDVRAKRVDIWHREGGVIHHLYTLNLTPVYGLGFSYLNPINILPLDTGVGWPRVSRLNSDWTVVSSVGESASYFDGDRIQATEFNNPFYFPAINSYRVDGIVLGLATNAVALSQGQFGSFPIFAFTTKGIWALAIGNGDILIESVKPMSGTICINKKSILGIDGGVIFISNEGLMILTGTTPTSISDMIINNPVSPLTGNLDYEKAIDNPNISQPKTYIDDVPFETYSLSASIAFVILITRYGVTKEIIVSNSSYNYSYVFNIMSKSWYRITQVWDNFVHDFPKTFGCRYSAGNIMDDLSLEQTDPTFEHPILVHAQTRPIKFGEEVSFKKISRTLLYGFIHAGAELPFTFFIFGTVDTQNWFVQQASTIITPGEKVALGRTSFSSRDFILVLGGYVYQDSYISGLICDIEKKYNLKLT